jgi:hypothetical protein
VNRILQAAALTVAAGAALLAAAGGAVAHDGHDGHDGASAKATGFLSGNVIQIPVTTKINVCGNTLTPLGGVGKTTSHVICVNR